VHHNGPCIRSEKQLARSIANIYIELYAAYWAKYNAPSCVINQICYVWG